MSLRGDLREWNGLAREDAMWAVYASPQRRGSWNPEEFFATGEQEIAGLVEGLTDQGLMPRTGRALDFGCGLGRLSRALSGHFEDVVGVDASRTMIHDAERLNEDVENCNFVLNEQSDLAVLPTASFDLVLSFITLQHVGSRDAIRAYIRDFARVTAPGGVIVFQLPDKVAWRVRLHPFRLLNRALRRLPVAPRWALRPLMDYSTQIVGLAEAEVCSILSASGATVATAFSDNRFGTDFVRSRTYVAQRPDAAA